MCCHLKINYLAPSKDHCFRAPLQHRSVQKVQRVMRGYPPPLQSLQCSPLTKFSFLTYFWSHCQACGNFAGARPDANSNPSHHQYCSATDQILPPPHPRPPTQALMKTNPCAPIVFIRRKSFVLNVLKVMHPCRLITFNTYILWGVLCVCLHF